MRFVVVGAGAVGGVVGGRLFEHGHDVVLVAQGDHGRAIAAAGLTLASATGVVVLPVPVTGSAHNVDWRDDDVVLLAVKSQDTELALRQLSASAPRSVAIVCVQNGVANEPTALRHEDDILAVLEQPAPYDAAHSSCSYYDKTHASSLAHQPASECSFAKSTSSGT